MLRRGRMLLQCRLSCYFDACVMHVTCILVQFLGSWLNRKRLVPPCSSCLRLDQMLRDRAFPQIISYAPVKKWNMSSLQGCYLWWRLWLPGLGGEMISEGLTPSWLVAETGQIGLSFNKLKNPYASLPEECGLMSHMANSYPLEWSHWLNILHNWTSCYTLKGPDISSSSNSTHNAWAFSNGM